MQNVPRLTVLASLALSLAACGQQNIPAPTASGAAAVKTAAVSSELALAFPGLSLRAASADANGNLYVGGSDSSGQAVLRKLSPSGSTIWSKTLTRRSGSGPTYVGRLATDRAGNVYALSKLYTEDISGTSGDYDNEFDAITKFAPDGRALRNTDGKYDDYAFAQDLSVDAAGNLYTIVNNGPAYVVKWPAGSSGFLTRTSVAALPSACSSAQVSVNRGGNVVYAACATSTGVALSQFKADLTPGYRRVMSGQKVLDLVTSPAGSAFTLRLADDFLLNKYNASGTWQWVQSGVRGESLAVNDTAKLYVDGGEIGDFGLRQALLEKRDPDSGELLWRTGVSCPEQKLCYNTAVTVDGQGKVWTVGSYGNKGTEGSFVARFAQ